jgi:hypothetical protein
MLANMCEAVASYETLHGHVQPTSEMPRVISFAKACILQAATTSLECALATSMKMGGGIKKHNFLATATLAFKNATGSAAPADHCHPALVELLK